jgi:hypothetical protein
MKRQILDKKTWIEYRTHLNGSYDFSDNWDQVIRLLHSRVKDFYFKPIDDILKPDSRKGEGFSVLTLQCALIEMFAAFRQGKIHNPKRPKRKEFRPKYEYFYSDQCFIEFLETEEIFEDHFYIKDTDSGKKLPHPIFKAKDFYSKVRCGLMHEARTKEDWLITAADNDNTKPPKFISYNEQDKTKKINRTILQERLRSYFEDKYLKELTENDFNGKKLRRLLARKLDHLYDIPKDKTFDWWKDK